MCVRSCFNPVWLFGTLWTVAHQAPLSMEFSRQEYWSGWSCPPPGDLPNPGIKPISLMPLELTSGFFTTNANWEAQYSIVYIVYFHSFIHIFIRVIFNNFKSTHTIPMIKNSLMDSSYRKKAKVFKIIKKMFTSKTLSHSPIYTHTPLIYDICLLSVFGNTAPFPRIPSLSSSSSYFRQKVLPYNSPLSKLYK